MISGLEEVDKGDIYLRGVSLIKDKNFLYRNIGLCSQEDIFFEYLTVFEHLFLMSKIKGQEPNREEIKKLIEKLGLEDKKDCLSSTLSGGQKRKLCIALALSGNSHLVLLDEPTSGMDVVAKRELWKILKEYRKDKIMILTTHSLEEAEVLGDRIGIMSEGKYICSGTSSYLKSQYPCGYNVNIIMKTNYPRDKLVDKIKKVDENAIVKISSKNILGINFTNIDKTEEVLDEIENLKNKGVEDYTISTTNLEDVFLKINSNNISKVIFEKKEHEMLEITEHETKKLKEEKQKNVSVCQEFCVDIKRNLISLWRNKLGFALELFAASATIFIYALGFNPQITENKNGFQNINLLLEKNDIYIYSPEKYKKMLTSYGYLKNKDISFIDFYPGKKNPTINEIDDYFYSTHKYKNERSVIAIFPKKKEIKIYNLYQGASPDYFQATMNLFLSSFFSKEFKIDINVGDMYSNVPLGSKPDLKHYFRKISGNIISILMIWNSFISLSSYVIANPLNERINNTKHLLYLSNARMPLYWITFLVVDLFKFLMFLCIVFPLLISLDEQYYYHMIIFIPFTLSSIIFGYCFSFLFDTVENGQKYYMLFSMLGSFVLPLSFLFRNKASFIDYFLEDKFIISECSLLPTSSLIMAMIKICIFSLKPKFLFEKTIKNIIINESQIFLLQFFVYCLVLVVFQKKYIEKIFNQFLVNFWFKKIITGDNQNKHFGVSGEEIYDPTTKVKELSKTFCVCCGKPVKAVRHVTFGLSQNEKFGLLGYNGSGKTTTFKSITNEILYDSGDILIHNIKVKDNFNSVRAFIGYCPQENALFDYLTVKEVIDYYRSLRGINENSDDILERNGLIKYGNKIVTKLSGGNKRKLSFAISMINNPKLLLLDEPSTGVDPESRRIMWKNILKLKDFNMILSTHSMEEAEVLCDTVSWLKDGVIIKMGNAEKMKVLFSAYKIHISLRNNYSQTQVTLEDCSNLKSKIEEIFGDFINNIDLQIYISNYHFFDILYKIVSKVKLWTKTIKLIDIQEEFFEFEFIPNVSFKKNIFTYLIKLKNNVNINELIISMESLEKILSNETI